MNSAELKNLITWLGIPCAVFLSMFLAGCTSGETEPQTPTANEKIDVDNDAETVMEGIDEIEEKFGAKQN